MEITVRQAQDGDATAIKILQEEALTVLRHVYRLRPQALRARRRALEGVRTFVAEIKGRIVGTCECYPEDERNEILNYMNLSVTPAGRRQGVAKWMLHGIAEYATREGFQLLHLRCVKETGNVKIFERCGFTVINEATSALFESLSGGTVTEVLLEQRLPFNIVQNDRL